MIKHGDRRARQSPEYRSWIGMKERCYNPLDKDHKHYGGRGISVCERWRYSFENFLADMGRRPSPRHSIDRINNNGDYEPNNCRWASRRQQTQNSRRCRLDATKVRAIKILVEAGFLQLDVAAWFGVHPNRISLIVRGHIWRDEDAAVVGAVHSGTR